MALGSVRYEQVYFKDDDPGRSPANGFVFLIISLGFIYSYQLPWT